VHLEHPNTQDTIFFLSDRSERLKAHELFAESACSQLVLDFLFSTEVGKIALAEKEEDAESQASE